MKTPHDTEEQTRIPAEGTAKGGAATGGDSPPRDDVERALARLVEAVLPETRAGGRAKSGPRKTRRAS